ncbi:MAG: GDP-mannose 4,6-dehydratase, partial [Melioribacter sp.]|nr:GDP-mannose 4,6-dehydratase [Melioribacter sp.]
MKTDSKTILITGGAGFIGSNLAEKLLKMGHSVYIMDNLDDYYDPEIKKKNIEELCNYKNIKIFIIDINDKTTLSQIFHKHLNK